MLCAHAIATVPLGVHSFLGHLRSVYASSDSGNERIAGWELLGREIGA